MGKSKINEKDFPPKLKIMNIFKILRKPYFAMFLASLILFASCTQSNDLIDDETSVAIDTEIALKKIWKFF